MDTILGDLGSINWDSLNASAIPNWLTDLASKDEKIRREAYQNLENTVVDIGAESWESHAPLGQVLKTDVPYLIIPFLIELLGHDEVENKERILTLLYDLVSNVYENVDQLEEPTKERAIKVYSAIRAGLDTYKVLYTTGNLNVRQSAFDVLSYVDPHVDYRRSD
jgi:hypothetical protein